MSDLNSLHHEIDEYRSKAQSLRDEANRLRASAGNYDVNGYPDKARTDTDMSLRKDKEADDYERKVADKESEARTISDKIRHLQGEINDRQSQIQSLSGGSNTLL